MSKYLKLIWFKEESWTKYHAAIGINASATVCGIIRSSFRDFRNSNRPILPRERLKYWPPVKHTQCLKCLAALRHRYGHKNVVKVKVE